MNGIYRLPPSIALAADLLDLKPPLDPDGIQRAYRKVCFEAHPDHGGSERAFRAVTGAKELLLRYVSGRFQEPEPPPRPRPPPPPPPKPKYVWYTSTNGNDVTTCHSCGKPGTVFKSDGRWKWVHLKYFSRRSFENADDAENALKQHLDGCVVGESSE